MAVNKIFVKNYDLGFWTQEEIPVVIRNTEGVITYCSHAGAEVEKVENQIDRVDEPGIVWTSEVLVCGKCKAYKIDSYWEDEPENGVHV